MSECQNAKCPVCEGSGYVEDEGGYPAVPARYIECRRCSGRGCTP